jgi:hypothetical protein
VTARSGALRRRRKPSIATRLRVFWVFIVVIGGLTAYAGYVLVTRPALRVHGIDVEIDGLAVNERQVLQAADIDRGANVWLLDTGRMAAHIEALPYVDTATVQRVPPAALAIHVTEREPAACVQDGTRLVTIDSRRRLLQNGCARASAIRIVLRAGHLGVPGSVADSPALATLLADGRQLAAANVPVRSLREDAYGQLVAEGARGIEFLLGDDADLAQKAKLIAPVVAAAPAGRAIRAIDLRAPATPTVEFR